ncbi:MAG: hypothetical protein SF052_00690 [Bacteroidia bacterium]|nr:hypothetical protein [Bacteroidia bacterium]
MNRRLILLPVFVLASLFFPHCTHEEPEPPLTEKSTWEVIQQQIFEPNCITCHTAGESYALESDLVLTANEAYTQLVDRVPHNEAAEKAGLLLVGKKGLESLYTSFLWEKINAKDQEHFYNDHTEYGEMMPLGGPFLTNGEIAFIREWILAGAPAEGKVVSEDLLKDTTREVISDLSFTPLTPPTSGFQMHLGPFDVIPNYEREFFYYEPLNNSSDVFVKQVEISMRPGTHHFILYDFQQGAEKPTPNQYRDLRDPWGGYILPTVLSIQDQVFFYGTQWRLTDYEFPNGVALRLKAGHGLDMNSHYVNRTNDTVTGEVFVNVHTVPASEVSHVAENIFLSNEDFELPPGKVTTIKKTYTFGERRHIFMLSSHAHQHMTEFRIFAVGGSKNGQLLYYTNDWQHPPILEMNPPLVLEAGQGLRAEATYNNNESKTLRFGLLSEDEMMIIFGAYYTD